MSNVSPNDPFAEFAVSKVSAVEAWKERRRQEKLQTRQYWGLIALTAIGAVVGASVATSIAFADNLRAVFATVGMATVGTLICVPGGCLVGAIAWGVTMINRGNYLTGMPVIEPEASLNQRNRWSGLVVLMTLCMIAGAIAGAGVGAIMGISLVRKAEDVTPAGHGGAMLGAGAGALAVLGLWVVIRRSRRPPA